MTTVAATAEASIKIARTILCPTTSKSLLPALFVKLSQTLQKTPEEITRLTAPRVPVAPLFSSFGTSSTLQQMLIKSNRLDHSSQKHNVGASSSSLMEKEQLSAANATYGETPPETIELLLSTLLDRHNNGNQKTFSGNFLDVGSGNGIPSICAAMTGIFRGGSSKGIEYDESRHASAMVLKSVFDDEPKNPAANATTAVEFTCGDVRQDNGVVLNGCSVIFCNATVWDAALCGSMGHLLDHADLPPHAVVVSISRRFPSPSFNLVDMLTLSCNGGNDFTFYVCQRQEQQPSSCVSNNHSAVSDTFLMQTMSEEDGLLEGLIQVASSSAGNAGLAFLTTLGASESSTRILLKDTSLLNILAEGLVRESEGDNNTAAARASSSMVLRAMSNFPVGRRGIAENKNVLDTLCAAVEHENHPAIRANLVDILGQVLYDPVGNQEFSNRNVDLILETALTNARKEGSNNVLEACSEAQTMRRWWLGEQKTLGGLTVNVLQAD